MRLSVSIIFCAFTFFGCAPKQTLAPSRVLHDFSFEVSVIKGAETGVVQAFASNGQLFIQIRPRKSPFERFELLDGTEKAVQFEERDTLLIAKHKSHLIFVRDGVRTEIRSNQGGGGEI